jgi:hypothetical protein
MVKVVILKKDGNINSFKVTGHADFGKHGKDIVCSAVSVLTQTTVIGLKKVAELQIEYKIFDGFLYCKLPEEKTDLQNIKSTAILETMYEGLKNIKKNYTKHIEIVEKEEV